MARENTHSLTTGVSRKTIGGYTNSQQATNICNFLKRDATSSDFYGTSARDASTFLFHCAPCLPHEVSSRDIVSTKEEAKPKRLSNMFEGVETRRRCKEVDPGVWFLVQGSYQAERN